MLIKEEKSIDMSKLFEESNIEELFEKLKSKINALIDSKLESKELKEPKLEPVPDDKLDQTKFILNRRNPAISPKNML